jgi:putative ABC transport system permease protein
MAIARLRRFFLRFYNVLRPARSEPDLARELATHLTLLEDDFQRRGLTPEEARLAARRAFGGVELTKENHRTARSFVWLDDARRDVQYAVRTFARNPGFAVVAVLTLALGIGANTAIFSAVNAILLRPLPYKDADRLVSIVENLPGEESMSGAPLRTTSMSVDDFPEWRRQTTTLSHMALQGPAAMTLTGRELAIRLSGRRASPSMFPMLGVHPIVGRFFEPNEEKPGLDGVVILSYSAWQAYFGADPKVIGRSVTLDERSYSVVGVLPRKFALPGIWNSQTDFWTPFALTPPPSNIQRTLVTARLQDGVTPQAAAAEAETISRALRGEPPQDPHAPASGPPRIEIVPLKDELVAPIRAARAGRRKSTR